MKIVFKSKYGYISIGDNGKLVEYEYYQIFNDKKGQTLSLSYCPKELVKIESINEDSINISYTYNRYIYPKSFCYDNESVTKYYKITKNKKFALEGNYMYHNYATGGENEWAELEIEWISYDTFFEEIMDKISKNNERVSSFANYLIENGEYDLAFKLLSNSKEDKNSYLLALCYEKGYGVEKNIDKAIEIYLYDSAIFPCKEGLERCLKEKEGRDIVVDNCKKMILAEQHGIEDTVERYIHIPLSKGDNSNEELRRCMSKQVKYVLEDRRYNSNLEEMEKLAKYYDMMNGVSKKNQPVYSEEYSEYDPYECEYDTYVRYHCEEIVATLQKEANKNDVIAIGVLINKFIKDIDNEKELVDKLTELCSSEICNEKDTAAYYLGLYYEREVEDKKTANKFYKLAKSLKK
ncbi:MAG: hypothetical protein IJV94_04785 [Bacilli bacterium]|nr:hypothetical protein [Bacilli bacterium]